MAPDGVKRNKVYNIYTLIPFSKSMVWFEQPKSHGVSCEQLILPLPSSITTSDIELVDYLDYH